jgi:hypothetical protein
MLFRKFLKVSPFVVLTVLNLMAFSARMAHAREGGVHGGGGDLCQSRIEEIRNDVANWINAGAQLSFLERVGSAQLDFTKTQTTLQDYNLKMLTVISQTRDDGQASISCTNDSDQVRVEGKSKVCMAYYETGHPRILCYRGKMGGEGHYVDGFMGATQDEQYFQVHHELAVLAGFEDQKGEETNYPFSRQISAHLEDQLMKKLAIRPAAQARPEESPPLVRDAWKALVENQVLIPKEVSAMISARSNFGLFELKVQTQLVGVNTGENSQVSIVPLWLAIAFDPAHPGNLAFARLRGALVEFTNDWNGGGLKIRGPGGEILAGLNSSSPSRTSRGSAVGIEVHQYLDITSNGSLQLYLHGAANLTFSDDSIRTIRLDDPQDAIVLGEVGVRLAKTILIRAKAQINNFMSLTDNAALSGLGRGYGAGVDWEINKHVSVYGDLFWWDTSGLDHNDGVTSIYGGTTGVRVTF